MTPVSRSFRTIVFLISLAALFAYPAFVFAQESIADSEALDAECPAGFDYTCTYPGTDSNGVPCGFGKPVASAEVIGHCVLQDKAMADKVISLQGDWGGTELPTASQEGITESANPSATLDVGTETQFPPVNTAPSDAPIANPAPDATDISSAPETETPAPESTPANSIAPTPESSTAAPTEEATPSANAPAEPVQTQSELDVQTAAEQFPDEPAPQENLFERISSTVTSDVYTVYDDVASFFGFSPAGTKVPTVPANVGIRG